MAKYTTLFPEHVLVATFFKVGPDVRIANDENLAEIFNDASKKSPSLFGDFSWHSLYRHSTVLSDALQRLDLGGAIVRENPPTTDLYFSITERTGGAYGASKYRKLTKAQRSVVEDVARRIRERFQRQEDRSKAGRVVRGVRSPSRPRAMVPPV